MSLHDIKLHLISIQAIGTVVPTAICSFCLSIFMTASQKNPLVKFSSLWGLRIPHFTGCGSIEFINPQRQIEGKDLHILLFTVFIAGRGSPLGSGTTVPVSWSGPINY